MLQSGADLLQVPRIITSSWIIRKPENDVGIGPALGNEAVETYFEFSWKTMQYWWKEPKLDSVTYFINLKMMNFTKKLYKLDQNQKVLK